MSFTREEMRHYNTPHNLKGVGLFLMDVVAISAYAFLAVWCSAWWLQLFFSFLVGTLTAVIFVIGHDAAHDALTSSRFLNRWIARIAFLPSLHPYSLWVKLHNVRHHLWTCLYPKDDVWTPLNLERYRALPWHSRALYRFYRSPAGPLLYYLIEFWFKKFLWPARRHYGNLKRQYLFDTLLVHAFAIGYVALLVYGARSGWFGEGRPWWNSVLFGAVLPFLIWNVYSGLSIYLHHTHPAIVWYDDLEEWRKVSRAHTAVHAVTPWAVQQQFHFIMEHSVHHLRPSVPLYNLKEAQAALEQKEGDRMVVYRWTPLAHLDICRRCKLFDFEAKRWTDFQGRYTSPPPREHLRGDSAGSQVAAEAFDREPAEAV